MNLQETLNDLRLLRDEALGLINSIQVTDPADGRNPNAGAQEISRLADWMRVIISPGMLQLAEDQTRGAGSVALISEGIKQVYSDHFMTLPYEDQHDSYWSGQAYQHFQSGASQYMAHDLILAAILAQGGMLLIAETEWPSEAPPNENQSQNDRDASRQGLLERIARRLWDMGSWVPGLGLNEYGQKIGTPWLLYAGAAILVLFLFKGRR